MQTIRIGWASVFSNQLMKMVDIDRIVIYCNIREGISWVFVGLSGVGQLLKTPKLTKNKVVYLFVFIRKCQFLNKIIEELNPLIRETLLLAFKAFGDYIAMS